MRVLLIGNGAREHALAERILESKKLEELFWLPGNAALEGRVSKVTDLDPCDGPRLATWAQRQGIDLAVIGPEGPLMAGVSDCLEEVGVPCFGPSKAAARLEGSKAFAKELMVANNIPTARYAKVDGPSQALAELEKWEIPVVIKADGLAAGKGVTVAMTRDQARQAALALTGPGVIVEYLEGAGAFLDGPGPGGPVSAPGSQPGPQAGGGRRHRPQHRRHGRRGGLRPHRPEAVWGNLLHHNRPGPGGHGSGGPSL